MTVAFSERHIGPSSADRREMLKALGLTSLDTLIAKTIPQSIRMKGDLTIGEAASEHDALEELKNKLSTNELHTVMIGQGYHDCLVPPVIQRNLFENPGWYTSYTPYQAEISQGRLEMLFHFQTLVSELAGLPVANASLLDEATAMAEAAGMALRHYRAKRRKLVIANALHPQNLDVVQTRCTAMEMNVVKGSAEEIDAQTAAILIQWPDTYGEVGDVSTLVEAAKSSGALVVVAADPMALLLLDAPGTWGADIVVGSMQRYGVPLGNGGPHAAYMACSETLTRLLPGRLVGQSLDADGNQAYRLALQTREQHIRREKATSNICTAQALLANMSAAYAIWHGPAGLVDIAKKINANAEIIAAACRNAGYNVTNTRRFDAVTLAVENADHVLETCRSLGLLIRKVDQGTVSISLDETTTSTDMGNLAAALGLTLDKDVEAPLATSARDSKFLTQEVFHNHRSETSMMRYLRMLMDKDLALDKAMIPLGSCTMKLNAAVEMMPVSWPEIATIHPFAPADTMTGYQTMIDDLDHWLSDITGFAKVSFQPNAGSQGEFAGLLAIRRYLDDNGGKDRKICLIPSSAHGTNPASAHMAGMDVVVVKCDDHGNIDVADLTAKAEKHADALAALMITYPSTHGVFEESVAEICRIIHHHGGQVYMDGANLNAMVGLARPGDIGADVCHMNLHKTFCIPHGGGGPGVGPIGVAAHLVPHLPGHSQNGTAYAVSSAPEGSASILPISWMYIRMLGSAGLREASEMAILNANYLAKRLEGHFDVLYRGSNGFVAHECIIDTRPFKDSVEVSVEDIAKRLMDYGFHAPTMSWPVIGTLMIEPTESEPKSELDRFADAMIAIRDEIRSLENGVWTSEDNPLHNAPHTAEHVMMDDWPHAYSRQIATNPSGMPMSSKYWPPVSRVDNVHGDRNLVCTCPPLDQLAS